MNIRALKELNINLDDRWVVSTSEDNEEARKKGLYKGRLSLAAKLNFSLSPTHIDSVVYLASDQIEEEIKWWNKNGYEYHLLQIEELLYLLEDFFPYYWDEDKTSSTGGEGKVFRILGLIRKTNAFPALVEKFYRKMEDLKKTKEMNSNE